MRGHFGNDLAGFEDVAGEIDNANIEAQKGTEAEMQQQIANVIEKSSPTVDAKTIATQSAAIAKKMMSGQDVGEIASDAIQNAGDLAGAMVLGKTASDLKTVGTFDSAEDYASAQSRDALDKSIKTKSRNDYADNFEARQKQIAEEKRQHHENGTLEQYIKEGQQYGFLDADGNAVKDGDAWVAGRSRFTATGMEKDEQGFIAGTRMNTVTNSMTGDSKTNLDGKRVTSSGKLYDAPQDHVFYNNRADKEAFNKVQEATNLKNDLNRLVSSGGTLEQIQGAYEAVGLSPEIAETAALYTAASGVALGVAEAATFAKSALKDGVVVQKTDKNGNKIFRDKNGIEIKQNKDGEFFAEKTAKDGTVTKETWNGNSDDLKAEKRFKGGVVSEGVRKVGEYSTDKLGEVKDSLIEKFSPTSSSTKQKPIYPTYDPTNKHQDPETNQPSEGKKQKSAHKTPPNSNDTDSVSKNTERGNSGKGNSDLLEQIMQKNAMTENNMKGGSD